MSSAAPPVPAAFGPRFAEAVAFASEVHAGHFRKGTRIPYVSHLFAVAAFVIEAGGNENEAIAGLLHDAIEDRPRGGKTEAEILARFGPEVLAIVKGCTKPARSWKGLAGEALLAEIRKERLAYFARLRTASPSVLLVAAADKLHNGLAVLGDFAVVGPALWSRFTGGSAVETCWYYREVAAVLREVAPASAAAVVARLSDVAALLPD